jgi:subtilase family serine protease
MLTLLSAIHALQQIPMLDPNIEVPSSSVIRAEDKGVRAHTNHLILRGPFKGNPIDIDALEANTGMHMVAPAGYGPSSIRAAYNLASTGGSGAHACVIAYHYKNARRDFNVFSTQYGLPTEPSTTQTASTNAVFQVVYQGTSAPATNTGWNQEAALDIEWSHSMAPGAKIYLVEANSASFADLNAAIKKAAALPGVRSVSMSFGANEFSGETAYESNFVQPNVVFFASTGDTGGQHSWPALSPSVVAVGGTSLTGSGASWSESTWSGSGCGLSSYFARPSYQNGVSSVVGTKRGSADISAVADPNTGCAVYAPSNQTTSTWMVFGGTSLSCPIIAGIYNQSGVTSGSSSAELTRIYARLGTSSFRDIITGSAGGNAAHAGYDLANGVGTPLGTSGF